MRPLLLMLVVSFGCDRAPEAPADEEHARAEERAEAPQPTQPSAAVDPTPLELTSSDGKTLVADWVPGAESTSPAVVLFHQLGRDRSEWEPLAASLARAGFGVLRMDLRGHGASAGGPDGWRSFEAEDWAALGGDGAIALQWLKQRPEAERPRAVVIGGSSIGSSVAILAGEDPMVAGVFALSPGRAYRGIDALTPVDAYPAERPILAVAASGEVASAETAREIARVAESGEVRLVEGSGHGLAMLDDQPGLVAVIEEFVQEVTER